MYIDYFNLLNIQVCISSQTQNADFNNKLYILKNSYILNTTNFLQNKDLDLKNALRISAAILDSIISFFLANTNYTVFSYSFVTVKDWLTRK